MAIDAPPPARRRRCVRRRPVALPPGAAQTSSTRAPGPRSSIATTSCDASPCTLNQPSRKPGNAAGIAAGLEDQRVGRVRAPAAPRRRSPRARRSTCAASARRRLTRSDGRRRRCCSRPSSAVRLRSAELGQPALDQPARVRERDGEVRRRGRSSRGGQRRRACRARRKRRSTALTNPLAAPRLNSFDELDRGVDGGELRDALEPHELEERQPQQRAHVGTSRSLRIAAGLRRWRGRAGPARRACRRRAAWRGRGRAARARRCEAARRARRRRRRRRSTAVRTSPGKAARRQPSPAVGAKTLSDARVRRRVANSRAASGRLPSSCSASIVEHARPGGDADARRRRRRCVPGRRAGRLGMRGRGGS